MASAPDLKQLEGYTMESTRCQMMDVDDEFG